VILALFDTGTVKIICESWLFVGLKGDLVPVVLDLKWVVYSAVDLNWDAIGYTFPRHHG
jgi:hypothetical protein